MSPTMLSLNMTFPMATIRAVCRVFCSSWGAIMLPTMLPYSHLACIMAVCRVICSS
jgi:hypothetical protein